MCAPVWLTGSVQRSMRPLVGVADHCKKTGSGRTAIMVDVAADSAVQFIGHVQRHRLIPRKLTVAEDFDRRR